MTNDDAVDTTNPSFQANQAVPTVNQLTNSPMSGNMNGQPNQYQPTYFNTGIYKDADKIVTGVGNALDAGNQAMYRGSASVNNALDNAKRAVGDFIGNRVDAASTLGNNVAQNGLFGMFNGMTQAQMDKQFQYAQPQQPQPYQAIPPSVPDLSNPPVSNYRPVPEGAISRVANALPQPAITVNKDPNAVQQPLPSSNNPQVNPNAIPQINPSYLNPLNYVPQGDTTFGMLMNHADNTQNGYINGLTQQQQRLAQINDQTAQLAQQAYNGSDWGSMLAARAQLAQLNHEKSQLTGAITGIQGNQIASGQNSQQAMQQAYLAHQLGLDTSNQNFDQDVYKNAQMNALGLNTLAFQNANDPQRQSQMMMLDNQKQFANAMNMISDLNNHPAIADKTHPDHAAAQALLNYATARAGVLANLPGNANYKEQQENIDNPAIGIPKLGNRVSNVAQQAVQQLLAQNKGIPTPTQK